MTEKINNGVYPVGAFLPSEPQLELIYKVSRTTIRRAISLLSLGGYISVQQGAGTKVISTHSISSTLPFHKFHNVNGISDSLHDDSIDHTIEVVALDRIQPTKEVVEALGVSPLHFVYRLLRILSHDNVPFGIMTTYLRAEPIPHFDSYEGSFFDLYAFLEEKYNFYFESGDEYISATTATNFDAPILHVQVGTPLLCCRRISKFSNCGPLEYLVTKLRPDIYQLRIHMEGPPSFLNAR